EASVACHSAPVAQVPRQDLLDQHVRCLDPNPNDAHQDEDHEIWTGFGGFLQSLQACLLDLEYLLGNEPLALHVAPELPERVGRDRLALGGAQMLQALRRLRELGIEAANAKPARVALMRLITVVCSPMRVSRSRWGRLASSSAEVGMAAILQCSRS